MGPPPRPLLFSLALAALLGAFALVALGSERGSGERGAQRAPPASEPSSAAGAGSAAHAHHLHRHGEDIGAGHPARPALARAQRAPIAAARRFLAAFLPYEVGRGHPRGARELRASAVPALARDLLARAPRPAGGAMAPLARLACASCLALEPMPGAAPRAILSGSLRRAGRIEPFALALERRGSRWLVAGVVE